MRPVLLTGKEDFGETGMSNQEIKGGLAPDWELLTTYGAH